MKAIWAPWRMEYIENQSLAECLFCHKYSGKDDAKNFILYRDDLGFILLNIYPYNNGHLMIAPKRHIADLTLLDKDELLCLMNLVQKGINGLNAVFRPDGFNIGMNVGAVAGAGIIDHLHIHIVPRWQGDTNFMPVLSETKVMPQHLEKAYQSLLPYFME